MSAQRAANVLQAFLEDNIPLARATEARIESYDTRGLRVHAPLQPNSNHHGSAFGGSLYVVALAAGWGLAHLILQEAKLSPALFVRHARADYQRPVLAELQAQAHRPADDAVEKFLQALISDGRGEINILVTMESSGKPGFELQAQFAARMNT